MAARFQEDGEQGEGGERDERIDDRFAVKFAQQVLFIERQRSEKVPDAKHDKDGSDDAREEVWVETGCRLTE